MTAYIVADLDIHDAGAWNRYVEAVVPLIEKYGGRSIVRHGAIKVLEGEAPKHFVVVQFDTMEAAARFYDAPEYAAPRQLRLKAATGPVFIVEGIPNA